MPQTNRQPFAKRSLGQNFLVDKSVVRRILDAFNAGEDDVIVEVGPGRGALTGELADSAGKLIVIEYDRELAAALRVRLSSHPNVEIVEADVLEVNFDEIAPGQLLRLISNLPYNISTAVLQKLFEYRDRFSDCVLMFQREVAERITAEPGSKTRGFLTVLTEAYFDVTQLFDVPPAAFAPRPKVWSSVVRLLPSKTTVPEPHAFSELVATGFAHKRKTIANNLKSSYEDYSSVLESAGIDPGRRAETLTLDEWLRLHSGLRS